MKYATNDENDIKRNEKWILKLLKFSKSWTYNVE